MWRQLSLLLVLCSCLVGCQSAVSLAKRSGDPEHPERDKRLLINDLSQDDLRHLEEELFQKASADSRGSSIQFDDVDIQAIANAERGFLREQIAKTPRGSQVGVYDRSGGRYCGTVLHVGPDRLEMMNCMSQETIPGPKGQPQCKKSHVPFLTIETAAVTHFAIIAPPPPNFPATDEEIAPSEYSVAEIVNRSGQRLSWGKAPEAPDVGTATVE